MRREPMKQQSRYFLRKRSRFANKEYYHESGLQDVGTAGEQAYINWTRYLDEARGFNTLRAAVKMADMVEEKYGVRVDVVNRHGEIV